MNKILIFGTYPEDVYANMRESKFFFIHHHDAKNIEEILQDESFELIVLSIRMKGRDGINILEVIKNLDVDIPVIITTGIDEPKTIVKAMRLGASDYIIEPFEFPLLELAIDENVKKLIQKRKVNYLEQQVSRSINKHHVSRSAVMQSLLEQVKQLSGAITNILITGESGTGKGELARQIHQSGSRPRGPFVDINCGAIPESLLESELFGHEIGSFTGAHQTRRGVFELAQSGTLFLDEIGVINENFQVKLLKVLEEKKFRRVGGQKDIHLDVQIITATNIELKDAVKEGTFREDLFYRINVLEYEIPPLRDRIEDLQSFTRFFLENYSIEFRKGMVGISKEVLKVFAEYSWPGNIRELKNVLERAVLLCQDGMIEKALLPAVLFSNNVSKKILKKTDSIINDDDSDSIEKGMHLDDFLHQQEIKIIEKYLWKNRWNKTKTAFDLGLKRTTLESRLKKFNIN